MVESPKSALKKLVRSDGSWLLAVGAQRNLESSEVTASNASRQAADTSGEIIQLLKKIEEAESLYCRIMSSTNERMGHVVLESLHWLFVTPS